MEIRDIRLTTTNGLRSIINFEAYKKGKYIGRFMATLREDKEGRHVLLGKQRMSVSAEDAPWPARKK
ncbi:hypothetical protein [uncultured Ilyobacter sp.]|uniref:hypothetical protein n=1 Tax=uncultured Ilyobacter sp. TaxID=544433 RepID=UPI002AA764D4|nr:hypothetical protein [uncultured Ilyobacter sp.]